MTFELKDHIQYVHEECKVCEDDPIRNNILLATIERRQSNNLLNALKNFDADDNKHFSKNK